MKSFIYTLFISLLSLNTLYAQDITFTFANAQITNDGVDDYYEADVMIASTVDFYVGSGQLYIEYNTDAFGENIANTTVFEYGRPVGSILEQTFFGGFVAGYSDFVEQNNTASRVSLSFQQNAPLGVLSSQGAILTTTTPKVLLHIKIKYTDVNELPEVCFYYDDGLFQDQFITACGGTGSVDCTNSPGIQLVNDTYDCSGAALSSNYIYNNGWTPSDPSGQSTSTSSIEIISGTASILANTIADNVVVRAGAGLSVNTGVTLETVSGLSLESSSTSYASLISDGSITGSIIYDHHVNQTASSGGNDLITPPVTGQSFTDFIANNGNMVSNAGNTLYLFGPFDKTSGTYQTYSNTETATLTSGVGYRAATTDNSTLRFEGTINQGMVNQSVFNSGPAYSQWNLVGNPYPSYLNVQNFLNNNTTVLDATNVGIYGYDGDASDGWVIYNLNTTDANTIITPGQAFFVAVDSDASVEFTPNMRRHGNTDDFIAGRDVNVNHHFSLALSTSSTSYSTNFYFNASSTRGLDLGYDAGVFGGEADTFAIYSHLVEDNQGVDLAIQSLPIEFLSDGMVPLGLNANAGEQLTIGIDVLNLPSGVEVYLIDTLTNTSTALNTTDYVFTAVEDLSGTGRFFIEFSNSTLSSVTSELNNLNVHYLKHTNTISIRGQLKNNTQAELYDINGRRVIDKDLDTNNYRNRLSTYVIGKGIYILKLSNSEGSRSFKMLIN
ncbi:T9SS type A sorting domain-containing protein [uncultured Winogradskyella sp.]|uniref:T9SS type A sorting domain-containing protein n=1 Tax=uncultured Winogradskyella sp. TaxID=395353 RepID=UPI0026190CBB|nr:T9SS type A sorting domain-containing protein [uncultured Winogradskyella sp.]